MLQAIRPMGRRKECDRVQHRQGTRPEYSMARRSDPGLGDPMLFGRFAASAAVSWRASVVYGCGPQGWIDAWFWGDYWLNHFYVGLLLFSHVRTVSLFISFAQSLTPFYVFFSRYVCIRTLY